MGGVKNHNNITLMLGDEPEIIVRVKDIIVGEINRIMLKYENIAEDCFQELDGEADGCFYLAKVNVCEEILQFIANMP